MMKRAGADSANAVAPVNPNPDVQSVTIANGASLSAAVSLGSGRLTALLLPAAWTAASLTFDVSADGVTFAKLTDQFGAEVAYTVVAGAMMGIDPTIFMGFVAIKLRSGPAAAPVNQGADRAFSVVTVG